MSKDNEYDFSGLDDTNEDSSAKAEYDFSGLEEDEKETPVTTSTAIGAGGGGVAGYKLLKPVAGDIVEGASNLAGKATDVGMSLMGGLKGRDIEHIRSNPANYVEARDLDDTLGDFSARAGEIDETRAGASKHITNNVRKVAKDVNEAGYTLAGKAKESLANEVERMPKEKVLEGLNEGLKKSTGAFNTISPEDQAKYLEEQTREPLNQYKQHVAATGEKLTGEIEMLKAKLDPNDLQSYMALNKEIKAKEAQLVKLSQDMPDTLRKIREQAAESFKQSTGIPQELLDLDPSLNGKQLNPAYKKIIDNAVGHTRTAASAFDPSYVGGKQGLIDLLRDNADFSGSGDSTTAKNIATNLSEGVRAKTGDMYSTFNKGMLDSHNAQKVSANLEAEGIKIGDDKQPFIAEGKEKKIEKMFANPANESDEYKRLTSALEESKKYSKMQPLPLAQERLQQATRLQNELAKYGVQIDPKTGQPVVTDSTKIVKYTDEAKAKKLDHLEKLIDEANTLSSTTNKSGKELIDEVRSGIIKDQIKNAGEVSVRTKLKSVPLYAKGALGGVIGGSVGGSEGATVGALAGGAVDVFGSKAQEKAAIAAGKLAGSTGVKAVKTLAKEAIPLVGGLASGYLGYNAAKELFPQEAAAAIGVAEGINPIPFTDVSTGAIEAKKDWDQNQSVPSAALAGAKGFVAPAGMMMDAVAEGRSEDARSVMEQNLNAFQNLKSQPMDPRSRMERSMAAADMFSNKKAEKEKEETSPEDFKSFVEQNPESLRQLADQLSLVGGGDNFAGPLAKAADSQDPKSRAAILFGLYQQPAFRKLHKKTTAKDGNE